MIRIFSIVFAVLLGVQTPPVTTPRQTPVRPPPVPVAEETPEQREARRMGQEYLTGDADAAVAYFAARPRPASGELLAWRDALASATYLRGLHQLLFTTEVAMRRRTFGKYAMSAPIEAGKSGIVGLNGAFELESFMVYRNLDDLLHIVRTEVVPRDREIRSSTATGAPVPPRISPVPAEDRAVAEHFFRQWHVVTISHCARWQLDCADTLLASAQQYFGETADVLTLSAAIAEARGHTSDARAWLQKALTVDSSHASARLRLGRMLAAAGRSADAERELTQALDGARAEENRGAMYFALTALADLDTRANRTARARQRRAEAAALGAFDHEYFAGLQPAAIYRAGLFYEQVWRVAALRRLSR